MYCRKLKCLKNYIFLFGFLYLLCNFNLDIYKLSATNLNDEEINQKLDRKTKVFKNKYLIGPGDKLSITFLGNKEFSGEYRVMSDGTISLPLLGTVDANYISIENLTEKMTNLYSAELIRPDLYIQLLERRPVQVSVLGEVNRPGLYKLFNIQKNNVPSNFNDPEGDFVNLPTVVDAISKAGGITPKSKLDSVLIKRRLDGIEKRYHNRNINLIDLLIKGDQSQNLILFDGDILQINAVENSIVTQKILKIAKGNLSPKLITINVIGAVQNPGQYQVKPNTTLNRGILLANGISPWKASKTNIQLLRVNNNGSISVKKYKFKLNEEISESKNPALIDGDIIKVNTNTFAKVTGGLKEITNPLVNVLSSYSLFKLISE